MNILQMIEALSQGANDAGGNPYAIAKGSAPTGLPRPTFPAPDPNAMPQVTPVVPDNIKTQLIALGNKALEANTGGSVALGSSGTNVSAPHLNAPNYNAADAAFALARPEVIPAPQYTKPDYSKADQMFAEAKPAVASPDILSNDMWGKIIAGAAGSFLSAPEHKLFASILGGLGGYGSALQNRAALSAEQADKMANYLLKGAGYETDKATNLADASNKQAAANYTAASSNQTNLTGWAKALGGYESDKASTLADVQNKNAIYGYDANKINSRRRGINIIGQNKGDVIYSFVDDKGNFNIGTKPISSINTAGIKQDPANAGLEALITTLRHGGALRKVLIDSGAPYDKLVAPITDYTTLSSNAAAGTTGLGNLTMLGPKGKADAYARAIAEENSNIATFFKNNPQALAKALDAVGQ